VAVGPLSAIKQKQHSYHADHQPHVGELDEGRVLAPQTLVAGSRRDGRTTLSLKAVKLAGRCAVVNPAGDYPVLIADYGGAKSVFSTDVQFANNLEGFEFQLSCGKDRIETLATTNFMPPARWLRNKKADDMGPVLEALSKKAVCWDTGAAFSTFPGALFKAWELGRVAAENIGIIDEISFLTKDKHTLLRCRNVPVRLDDEEIIIGGPILNLFRMGFDPNGARIGLSIVWRQKWNLVPVEFETDRDLGTFISWKKPQPV
jgi:hypothetical protein